MRREICKHCGEEIGLWWEDYPGFLEWMHAPDDGPDAYSLCKCHCFECDPRRRGYTDGRLCIDGKEAEPKESVQVR